MLFLSALQLSNVHVVDADLTIRHRLLPIGHGSELHISLDSVLCPIQELLSQLESTDEHQPRAPAITRR